ncbi:cupin domain-containing protein [Candidatus Solirubrobacter pratensis]|uniref:cupin domain-containing protein n=1 Tax=Candidatus Solirubrobacter pratensis TaxID=1298857 RepID=UPI000421AF57|nr:cupin domain-containing protein [Candidatus Solirubrobacter pratensis]
MPVITPEEAPTFDAPGATITGLASPSRGSADTSAWRVRLAPGHASPLHSLDREEVFVVLEGELTARYATHDERVGAGGALIVKPGAEFSLIAEDGPAEAVCMLPVGGTALLDGERIVPPWAV